MRGALAAAALLVAGAAYGADYVDVEAGIRFPVPFTDAQRKTGAQIKALVTEQPGVTLPEGARYTGGLYARGGVPFIVVWARRDRVPPSRSLLAKIDGLGPAALARLYGLKSFTFDAARLRGVGEVESQGGLRGRMLVQVARGETVGVGYYDVEGAGPSAFDQLVAGFELAPDRRLTWDELPRGIWFWVRLGAAGAAFAAMAAAASWWLTRRAQPAST